MKALAAFIVRGRGQAILVAALSGIVAFILPPLSSMTHYLGAAVVGLVTLYISPAQGFVVLAAATAITTLFYQFAGMPAAAMAITVLLLWLPCWLLSIVLRNTASLAATLQAGAVLGVLALLAVFAVYGDPADWWLERLQTLADVLEQAGVLTAEVPADELLQPLSRLMTGIVLASLVLGAIGSILLARWWQALLVNPGGLRKEFIGIRLGQGVGVLTLAVMLSTRVTGEPFSDMASQAAMVLLVPYLFVGLAVLHGLVAARGRGKGLLIVVYVLLAIMPQATLLLAGGGLLDTWIDFRRRLGGAGSNTDNET